MAIYEVGFGYSGTSPRRTPKKGEVSNRGNRLLYQMDGGEAASYHYCLECPVQEWAKKLKIQLISTSVYHPRENGAVERANKSLLRGIKTRLGEGRIDLG
ncbi:reverse transcriptase domain-containing protein [Tanacetum coccineum]